nr:hypothetical protein [Tanacetum cinerariifolium]
MSTCSSSTNLFPPSSNPESIIRNRRRNLGDPFLLLDFEEINMNPNNVQGPPPMGLNPQNHGPPGLNLQNPAPSLRTMEELLQAPTDGVGDVIVVCTSRNKPQVSSANGSSSQNDAITALTKQVKALVSSMNKPIHSIQEGCETCGGLHSYFECQAAGGYAQDVYATTENYNAGGQLTKVLQERPQGALPSNTIPNPREEIKLPHGVLDPQSHHLLSLLLLLLRRSFKLPPSSASRSSELPKRNHHQPHIPYPSRLNKDKLQDKSDIQIHKFLQMFKKLHINISLVEALALMPKYAKMLKDLIFNKEKLLELEKTPLTENCSRVLLKKLLEKLRDPGKFLIPCDFSELEECMALADLGTNINLMPPSVWKKLMLLELVPTRMTLELANRSVAYPAGIAGDVYVSVGKFTFHADFIVVEYDIYPCVPLILGRPSLRTTRTPVDKSIHPFSCSTTSPFDSFHSLTPFKTSDSLLEEFADELALIRSFPPRNDDIHFDAKSDLRELEYFLNRGPSIDSSLQDNIEEIDSILDEFVDEPSLVDSFPSEKDDDLFDFENDNDEWRNIFIMIYLMTFTLKKIKSRTLN